MIEASTQFMVGRVSTESGKCNSFNLDGIFGNDTRYLTVVELSILPLTRQMFFYQDTGRAQTRDPSPHG